MIVEIDVVVRNKALNKAFITNALENGNIIIKASDDVGWLSGDVIASFSQASGGAISLSGIVQIPVSSGIVTVIGLQGIGGRDIAKIELDPADYGDFTSAAGTYQINTLIIRLV